MFFIKIPMTGIELRICGIGINLSANWATTTAYFTSIGKLLKLDFTWMTKTIKQAMAKKQNVWQEIQL